MISFGIDAAEAHAEAEIMLKAASGLSGSAIILKGHEQLAEPVTALLEGFVARREKREPLQHILGESFFMGLKFFVDKRVLIPRPETELLVEKARALLEKKSKKKSENKLVAPLKFLDIGVGSGAIALSLLHFCPQVHGVAWEVSPEAAAVCAENARALDVCGRLDLHIGDFFADLSEPVRASGPFDLFVSNPPYIASSLIDGLAPEVRDFEPHTALVGKDPDGLGFYRAFATALPALASPQGASLLAEFGEGQGQSIEAIFREAGWEDVLLLTDLSGKDRIVLASLPARQSQSGL